VISELAITCQCGRDNCTIADLPRALIFIAQVSRPFRIALSVLVPVTLFLGTLTLVEFAGLTNAYGTGVDLRADTPMWLPDGAKSDTFWDSQLVDMPGLSLYTVHCHGRFRADLQVGATGSDGNNNPCYAAMGMYDR
jgi:hypothetical protein